MMRILILGINHQIQSDKICSSSTNGTSERFEHGQKENFKELLRRMIAEQSINLVGEEANHGTISIAETLCKVLEVRYVNIEMTVEERERRSIPPGYQEEGSTLPEPEKKRGNIEREEYMVQTLLAAIAEARSALAICGRFHTTGIATRLEARGHIVEVSNLQDQGWYVEDWMTHMMHL